MSKLEDGAKLLLEGLEEEFHLDLADANFTDTPKRIAKAYREIFSGIQDTKNQVKTILSKSFPSTIDEMIVSSHIQVYSMCPHHFLPVEYLIDVGYLPKGKVLGISKLARLVEVLAKRPVLQETLTTEIVDYLVSDLDVLGSICRVRGIHYCMKMRGAKQNNSVMITSALRGAFADDDAAKSEFLSLVDSK